MEEGSTMKIYLAHSKRQRLDGKWIEHQIKRWGYEVYNPFDGNEHAKHLTKEWNEAEEERKNDRLRELSKPIYEKDIKAIRRSDLVVVYYPDESTGTAMEMPIAKLIYRKPVIVLTDRVHPFVQTLADHVVPANPDALKELRKILETFKK